MNSAMRITLYSKDDEIKASFSRSFVPWKLLKQAVRLQKQLSDAEASGGISEQDIDELANLVVETFGNQFSIDDLNEGADIGEMMTVLNTIVAKAMGSNPTLPPGK